MSVEDKIKKVAKEFNLIYKQRKYRFITLPKKDIIIRNFLSDCPDSNYTKFRNKISIDEDLTKFLGSKEFKLELKKDHGFVTTKPELYRELKIVKKFHNTKLKGDVLDLYNKIRKSIGKNDKLVVLYRDKNNKIFQEVLIHEFIHILLESNNIRPKPWKLNEGLVIFLTYFSLGKHKDLEDKPKKSTDKMWNIGVDYAHKWAQIFKNTTNPRDRKTTLANNIQI